MIKQRSFGIVGGGIGGLTLAIALQQRGFKVNVYENAPEFKSLGAGIVLAANAFKALKAIDLDQKILKAGKELKRFTIKDQKGRVLSSTNAEVINKKYGLVNTLTLHRAELHQVLIDNLKTNTIQFDKGCRDFSLNGNKVSILFKDGTTTEEDYVIAADGINSVFRKKLLPETDVRYSGYTCWRAVTDTVPANFNQEEATETWGAGKRFGIVPLAKNRIYWFATVDAAASDNDLNSFKVDQLRKMFQDFHAPVNELLTLTRTEQLIKNDIFDLPPIKRFAFGRVALLGDAAHATTPNLGQGACMAIEDAVVLANCMKRVEDPESGFRMYEQMRIQRTTKIVNASYNMGRVAQLKNPLLVKLRNAALRFTPESVAEKQLDFLYNISFSEGEHTNGINVQKL